MRKCLCCIPVGTGSIILGSLGVIICALELVVLVPYLMRADIDNFNPIQKNLDTVEYTLEKTLNEQGYDQAQAASLIGEIKSYVRPTFLAATIEAGLYGLASLLLIIGAKIQVRWLMLPYLIIQMLAIIVFILAGVGSTVGLFFMNVIGAVVAGVVVLIIAIILIYFWAAVQRAYSELGSNDYMYSPAPIKPVNNEAGRGYQGAPNYFHMDERK